MLKTIVAGLFFVIFSMSYASDNICNRSTCGGGEAVTNSPNDNPAVGCDTEAICKYVSYYLATELLAKEEGIQPDTEDLRIMERLRLKAKVDSFQDASKKYHVVLDRQRVKIRVVNHNDNFAQVSPVGGAASYWIEFDSLISIKKTRESFANNDTPSQGSAVLAALVNAQTGMFNFEYLDRQSDSLMPQSFDERISFTLPEVSPKGGQIFVCSKKKNCDAIFAYFDALKGMAGPYLYRNKDGRVVAQLNSRLKPDTAEAFESALRKLKY